MLADLFERLEAFFRRLESLPELLLTGAMPNIIAKIIAEVLSILATATNEIKQARTSMFSTSVSVCQWLMFFSIVCEDANGQQRYRGCAEEAGQTYLGGGSDRDNGNPEGHT
jgi:hypothetical protein